MKKKSVWYGLMSTFIFVPDIFEEVTGGDLETCTVTSIRYLDMLTYYAIPELQLQNALYEVVWMQDGVPPHVGSSVKRLLNQQLGDRVMVSKITIYYLLFLKILNYSNI